MRHPFRQSLSKGLLGTFLSIPSPTVSESLGTAGLDFVCIDAEHGVFDQSLLQDMMRACDLAGLPALVRVPELGVDIGRSLDLGAAGVLVPRIETASQAREAVRRARYAPQGGRGVGPARASGYGSNLVEQIRVANDDVMVVVQIETAAGIDALDEIAAVEGIDALLVGPFDLAVSLGCAIGGVEHQAAIDRVMHAARSAGIGFGLFVMEAPQARAALESGVSLVIAGSDLKHLVQGVTELARNARSR